MLQIAERVYRSLIDRWCGIGGGGVEKVSKTNSQGVGVGRSSRQGWKKLNILTAKEKVGF